MEYIDGFMLCILVVQSAGSYWMPVGDPGWIPGGSQFWIHVDPSCGSWSIPVLDLDVTQWGILVLVDPVGST